MSRTDYIIAGASIILPESPYSPSPWLPTGNLVGEWKFDEGVGDSIFDYSGNNWHLTLPGSNKPAWITGGLRFVQGVTNPILYQPGVSMCPPGDFSFVLCAKLQAPPSGWGSLYLGWGYLWHAWYSLSSYTPKRFGWESGNDAEVNDQGWLNTNRVFTVTHTGPPTSPPGGQTPKLYVGSALKAWDVWNVCSRNFMGFSRFFIGDSYHMNRWCGMDIYYLVMYGRVLTASEVAIIHANLQSVLGARGVVVL